LRESRFHCTARCALSRSCSPAALNFHLDSARSATGLASKTSR
jgi:hypothetical protein